MSITDPTSKSITGLPETLRIFGKQFHVRALKDGEQEDADGLMDLNRQEIMVRPKEALEQVQDTALHETIHAIDESLVLGMTEAQVHKLAVGLLGVLKDNQIFTKWLLQER